MEKKKLSILIIALFGFFTTIKLAAIYYNANFNPYALASFCSVNDFIDCDGIARTTTAQFMGIPLAYWGMFLYLFMIFMLFVDKLKNIKFLKFLEVFKNPYSYIAALGFISFAISIILLILSVFEIKKLCVLCAVTYCLNLLIGIFAVQEIGYKEVFVHSFRDFIDAIKVKRYAIAFTVVVLVACGFLTYTKISCVFAPQIKNAAEFKQYMNAKVNKYAVSGNLLGKEDAKYVIHSYTDYLCPMCGGYDIMIHKLVKEMKDVKVIHHNYPLDTECNKYLQQEFHHGSCMMARFAVAAENQGKLWDMNNMLFRKKPETEKEILEIAKDLGLDLNKLEEDANSLATMHKIQKDIDEAHSLGIAGTPCTVINGKIYMGMKPIKKMKEIVKNGK